MNVALASKPVSVRPAVQIEQVGKRFGSVQVLDGISIEVAAGEFVALLGPSGCGKTTLLRLLAGLETMTIGTILIGGTSALEARRRQEIGVAFQRPALVPARTALGNVELTLEICRRAEVLSPRRLLQEFGLGQFMQHYPHQLSGGMQQRVNIACALVHHPQLLLLDEPFGALDELTREAMCEWLGGVLAKSRQTVVLVTHSVEEAVTLADRVVVLSPHPGRIHEIITVELERPRVAWVGAEFLEEVSRVRRVLRETVSAEVRS